MPPQLPADVLALFDAQHGVATASHLTAIGFGDARITTAVGRGTIVRLHRGAYALATKWSDANASQRHCLRLWAVQLAVPDAAGWVETAALVWRLPVADIPALPVVARSPQNGHRVAGATVCRLEVGDCVVLRHGLTISTIGMTTVAIAAKADLTAALITVDAALRRGVAFDELVATAQALPAHRGRERATRAVEAGDPASESALESISRGGMIVAGLPMPLCNVVIRLGNRWYRVDFLWMELGVVGECDGKLKYADAASVANVLWREKRRHEQIEESGLRIARWGYAEAVDGGAAMVKRIQLAIDSQARAGFTWPTGVRVEVPVLPGTLLPTRVVAEVRRLRVLGFPIRITDEARAA